MNLVSSARLGVDLSVKLTVRNGIRIFIIPVQIYKDITFCVAMHRKK